MPLKKGSELISMAALEAGRQGKFYDMDRLLRKNFPRLNMKDLIDYAQQIGLDIEAFKKNLKNRAHRPQIESDIALAQSLGVRGTPTFFINGRRIVGAQPYEVFKKVIDEELLRRR